ncbi:unnamed protein product [Phaeothamnion confervicola]
MLKLLHDAPPQNDNGHAIAATAAVVAASKGGEAGGEEVPDVDFTLLRPLLASRSGEEDEERQRLDGERQLVITVLLAQVCAQLDVTPRTFCDQALRLYERGVLDSLEFLYEWRYISPPLMQRLDRASEVAAIRASLERNPPVFIRAKGGGGVGSGGGCGGGSSGGVVGPGSGTAGATGGHGGDPGAPGTGGGGAEDDSGPLAAAPLGAVSSRYLRDYVEMGLIARGAFGDVFRSRHRLDGSEYAVKKVSFASASGLQNARAQLSLREVTNLSKLDHPNVVRYHTAWLESNWASSRGTAATVAADSRRLLMGDAEAAPLAPPPPPPPPPAAAAQMLSALDGPSWPEADPQVEEVSEWSGYDGRGDDAIVLEDGDDVSSYSSLGVSYAGGGGGGDGSIDDIVSFRREGSASHAGSVSVTTVPADGRRSPPSGDAEVRDVALYNKPHTITLFIQMALCRGATLQEFLRSRNRKLAARRAQSADWTTAAMKAAVAATVAPTAATGREGAAGRAGAAAAEAVPMRQRSMSACSDSGAPSPKAEVDIGEALGLFAQLMRGISHVHAQGVLHRDLKPENIFLVEEMAGSSAGITVKIGDFGLSTAQAGAGVGSEDETRAVADSPNGAGRQSVVGTASYAAPENLAGRSYARSADIFSLGLILLELCCPFQTGHERAAAFATARASPPSVPAGLRRRHPQVAALALRLTEADPAARPTAEEVLEMELFKAPTPEEAALRHQLAERDARLKRQEEMIQTLQRRLEELGGGGGSGKAGGGGNGGRGGGGHGGTAGGGSADLTDAGDVADADDHEGRGTLAGAGTGVGGGGGGSDRSGIVVEDVCGGRPTIQVQESGA